MIIIFNIIAKSYFNPINQFILLFNIILRQKFAYLSQNKTSLSLIKNDLINLLYTLSFTCLRVELIHPLINNI